MKTKYDLINEIMDWFDFHKVAKAVEVLGWEWAGAEFGVPSEPEIRKEARELMFQAWGYSESTDREYTIGTGGLEATADTKANYIRLKFVLEDWEAFE